MWVGTAVVLVLALAIGAVGSAPAAPHSSPQAQGAQGATGASHATAQLQAGPTRLGPTDPAAAITISLSLALGAPGQLSQALASIYDPSSPDYHHYLTPAEFASRFGSPQAVRARAESVLRAAGLAITPAPSSLSVNASGTVGQVESFFGVRLDNYRTNDGKVYYAPAAPVQLPTALQGIATGVLGLDNRPLVHSNEIASRLAGHPTPQLLGPKEISQAYDLGPLAGLDGNNQTIAFVEIDTFNPDDITAYDQHFDLTTSPVQKIQVNGGAEAAKGVSETTLDIEVVHAIAPKATLLAYEGPADFKSLATSMQQIVTDNRAQVISISLGSCEAAVVQSEGAQLLNTLTTIFQQAAAQGITVLAASGDDGAYTCHQVDPTDNALSISVPADNPYVTAVGGTALFLNDDGNNNVSYGYEAGWEGPLEGSGGGGGVSLGYPIPDWQTGPGVSNQYSTGKRQIPDVSADADPLSGYLIFDSTGGQCTTGSPDDPNSCWNAVGGTSAASPLWGALVALANQQAAKNGKKTMGFIDPTLYKMGRGELGQSPFHDVTVGGNLFYQAGQSWDYSTGWGTPDAALVVQQLTSQASS
jgi:kumamolisin